jgi:hypothetical protein
MTDPRVVRGRQTEEWVAEFFRENGWPGAERRPASLPGSDIMGMPAFAIEVKARRNLNLPAWLKQASSQPGLPMVIHRPDGFGKEKLALYPVTFRLQDVVPVLRYWDCLDGHVLSSET